MCRVVMRPELLRPPVLASGRTSDFSGAERVISTKSATLAPRRPGVVGLYLRIPMGNVLSSSFVGARSGDRTPEDVDGPLAQGHDGALGVLALAQAELGAPGLALAVQGVDRLDLDTEGALDRDLDLGLVGPRVDDEGVGTLVEQPVALLRDDRCQQDVARVLVDDGAHLASSRSAAGAGSVTTASRPLTGPATKVSNAAWVKTTSSAHSTS